jgi:hypothetical protein
VDDDGSAGLVGFEEERQDFVFQYRLVAKVIVLNLGRADVGLPECFTVPFEQINAVIGELLRRQQTADPTHTTLLHEGDLLADARRLPALNLNGLTKSSSAG